MRDRIAMDEHKPILQQPSVPRAETGRQPWATPTLRHLSAKDAETGILFGPETLVLLS